MTDDDWIPGKQNRNGVYCPTETLTLQRDAKGWRGCPRVEIDLVELPEGWRSSLNYSFFTGSHMGSASPTTDRDPLHPTRRAAIAQQVEKLRGVCARLIDESMKREALEMLTWADSLIPDQLDLFGEAA
ncbi:MAG TPA: hypothetical protein VMQ93_08700 [Novosphingobium sp.]|nr:hypothetical protein [Novosphingobium sp.]